MSFNRSFLRAVASFMVLAFVLLVSSSGVLAQDPTGRPTDPKGKKTTGKTTKQVKVEPGPVTITLTILTDPPESAVFVNGEERGVTNSEGKVQFEKLGLGHYSIEVRKEGYGPMLRGFDAGAEAPTLVFKLEPKLDDYIKEFNSLIGAGKLTGPDSPNALELVTKLTTSYGSRAEVTTLKGVLAAKFVEALPALVTQTVTNWRAVTRDQMVRALDATTNSLALKKDNARTQALAAYFRGAMALRDWQTAGSSGAPKTDGAGDGSGSVAGPGAARAEFENALKLDDTLTAAWYQHAIVLLATGDASGAEATLMKVTVAEPRWASANIALGWAFYTEGKFAESHAAYQKAIAVEANSAVAIAGLGLARVGRGDKDGIKDVERAIKLDPNSAFPHLDLAIVLSQSKSKKDWTRSEEEFKKAMQLNAQNLDFQNSYAERLLAEVQKRKK